MGPARLAELAAFIEGFAAPLAIEVRHPAFFDRGDGERALNRLLRDRGVERICLDSRALFSCRSSDPALLHAQSKKPRLPVRPVAFSDSPQLRFVGIRSWKPTIPFSHPGWTRWRTGSRRARRRTSICIRRTTTAHRNWPCVSTSC